jgi:hypothetical protein
VAQLVVQLLEEAEVRDPLDLHAAVQDGVRQPLPGPEALLELAEDLQFVRPG